MNFIGVKFLKFLLALVTAFNLKIALCRNLPLLLINTNKHSLKHSYINHLQLNNDP